MDGKKTEIPGVLRGIRLAGWIYPAKLDIKLDTLSANHIHIVDLACVVFLLILNFV